MNRILPVVLVALAVGLIFVYIRPTFSGTISTLQGEISVDNQALAAADRFTSREALLTSQRNAIPSDDLDRIEAYVPDSVDTVRVVIDLNALASRSGVSLSGFSVSGNSASAGGSALTSSSLTDTVELSLTATGTYSAFRVFLGGLETSLRPYDVVDIAVKDSPTGVYTYTLTLRTYELK